jgi:rhamnogalacturonyl hydrolase YesR
MDEELKLMKYKLALSSAAVAALLLGPLTALIRADEIPEKYRKAVDKGLEWLAARQNDKGMWGANGDNYPISMTALAGMALLMEGSTVRDGKYAAHIRKAVDFLMDKSQDAQQRDGMIGDPTIPTEAGRYMYGHGFATLFLASVYGEETDAKKRARLTDILTRAVRYIGNAQSTQGGWFYTSKADGHDQDEGSVTVTQMQALRACRDAGIPVPKDIINKGIDYLSKSTTQQGGVVYSLVRGGVGAQVGGERPALTAAAISCGFSAGEYKGELCKKWLKYCQRAIPLNGGVARLGHDEYTHYYYAQALYILGDNGWENLFGPTPEADRLTWTKYRDQMGDRLLQLQAADGSFPSGGGLSVGPVYSTAVYLAILQLDKAILPIYQR